MRFFSHFFGAQWTNYTILIDYVSLLQATHSRTLVDLSHLEGVQELRPNSTSNTHCRGIFPGCIGHWAINAIISPENKSAPRETANL